MGADRMIRAFAVAGMLASALWIVALVVEYQFALRPPGDDSDLYKADQAAFLLAEAGYLAMLIGLYRAHPGGHRWFGRVAIGLWIMGIAAILLALILGLFRVEAVFLLPIGGLGQLLGSIFTAVAVVRTRVWTGWRRLTPAIWTAYFLFSAVSVIAAIPVLTIPAAAPSPRAPSPVLEAVWQGAWFLLSLALYLEAGRASMARLERAKKVEGPALQGSPLDC
jgi:hypothetical protein